MWSQVKGFQCTRYNHLGVVLASDVGTPKMLTEQERAKADEKDGFFMFHYLFDCFDQGKKRLTKHRKWDAQRREHTIDSHRNKINSLKLEISNMEEEIAYLEKFDQLNANVRSCPFQRKKPETYKPDYLL